MINVLKNLGLFLIILGIMGATVMLANIDWASYSNLKAMAISTGKDPISSFASSVSVGLVNAQIGFAIGTAVSGIISGIFFVALSTIVQHLEDISWSLREDEE